MAKEEKIKSGVDDALSLEAVYYTNPIPQNQAVLTILGAVFDKVHFPGVCMPMQGFDQKELEREIKRIEDLKGNRRPDDIILPMLKFIRHAKTLEGFCVFSGDYEKPFDYQPPPTMVRDIFDAIHGKQPDGWEPMFMTNHHKGIPGSDEHITYPGTYHYLAGAILESAKTGIPLLNDIPGIPIPGIDGKMPADDAKALATIIAIECTKLALPQLPMLRPEDLMEFRAENADALRAFRRSMLRYAADLNKKLSSLKAEELESKTTFFIQTEIVPVLDELQAAINAPARAWWKRSIDFVRVIPELAAGSFTMDPATAIAKVLTTYAGQMFVEMSAKGDQREALKRAGLYYLLRLRAFQAERAP
ncbi:hypothetical protein [Bradyrhizobium stylosanthis]|uniref:Uncharacterized protein n=1 Tax=Bradyrhizobium stylosanthis TaxID=1803665 RepID=A0A560DRG6_9BRAD|nr:hypothetical protein [Bradyrhizobium stylosanthis]TWA99691.1 hypothetical protein FBZ96_104667 [Bradyrhizobium stylosanthis]